MGYVLVAFGSKGADLFVEIPLSFCVKTSRPNDLQVALLAHVAGSVAIETAR